MDDEAQRNVHKSDEISLQSTYKLLERLQQSNERYIGLVASLSDVVFECDEKGLIFLNAAWASNFGYSIESSLHTPLAKYIDINDRDKLQKWLDDSRENPARAFKVELRLIGQDDAPRWVEINGIYSIDRQLFAGVIRDINLRKRNEIRLEDEVRKRVAELSAVNQKLADMARHDPLTGLNNRMSCDERLKNEFQRMKRTRDVYSVLMLDIDFFKDVNDSCGHMIGDEVLQSISHVLTANVRTYDFVARWGGEEFLVILPATGLARACRVAEKIRTIVAGITHPIAGSVSVSVGAATASCNDLDQDIAVAKADNALYEAKKSGRNCVKSAINECRSSEDS